MALRRSLESTQTTLTERCGAGVQSISFCRIVVIRCLRLTFLPLR
jgi:hypothetical protein